MANSIETWFTALTYQNKQLFLVTLGANLTAFARQATRLGELRGMNEIHHHIYQAIKTMSVGQLTFSADEFWEVLNSVAKEYRLDMALHQVLEMSTMLIEDKTAQCADYKQNSMNVALTRTQEKTSRQADPLRLAFIAELPKALNDSAVKRNVTRPGPTLLSLTPPAHPEAPLQGGTGASAQVPAPTGGLQAAGRNVASAGVTTESTVPNFVPTLDQKP